jgi:hypothetical protein
MARRSAFEATAAESAQEIYNCKHEVAILVVIA